MVLDLDPDAVLDPYYFFKDSLKFQEENPTFSKIS